MGWNRVQFRGSHPLFAGIPANAEFYFVHSYYPAPANGSDILGETEYGIHRRAGDGAHGVYDLMPNAGDYFGIWTNKPDRVNPDYYITADGKSGIVVRHVQAGAPYCIWYSHWQGLNPAKGVGWRAFTTVVAPPPRSRKL